MFHPSMSPSAVVHATVWFSMQMHGLLHPRWYSNMARRRSERNKYLMGMTARSEHMKEHHERTPLKIKREDEALQEEAVVSQAMQTLYVGEFGSGTNWEQTTRNMKLD
ncbi:unnamed protein product [Amoebophrya sp. A120]|nr:unnamed protein product [Amoebophrya sp. A120]|eukprot:GSA120T00001991001.1